MTKDTKTQCLEKVDDLIGQCMEDRTMYGYTKGFVLGLLYGDVISQAEHEALQARIDEANRKRYLT